MWPCSRCNRVLTKFRLWTMLLPGSNEFVSKVYEKLTSSIGLISQVICSLGPKFFINVSFPSDALPLSYYFVCQLFVTTVQDKTHYQSSETQVTLIHRSFCGHLTYQIESCCDLTFWHRSFTFNSNHQPDATIFQFIILTFVYISTSFGRFPAHHQELNDCNDSLWFYLCIVVIVVLLFVVGPAGWPDHEHSTAITTIRR